jgi:DNA (cytosine-5)-methyltransferase 1
MTRPLLLDLFCGAGGAAMGYYRAGFDVVGVDINPQPHYPFRFVQADALTFKLSPYDAIHASPPCQRYSDLAHRNGNGHKHPDLIGPIRNVLRAWGGPWVIENVEGAPLLSPVSICGIALGLRVIRHRLFESNVPLQGIERRPHPLCFTRDKRKQHYGRGDEWTWPIHVNGGGNASVAAKLDAMGVNWPMTGREINEAVPPAYTEFIGEQLLAVLNKQTPKPREA